MGDVKLEAALSNMGSQLQQFHSEIVGRMVELSKRIDELEGCSSSLIEKAAKRADKIARELSEDIGIAQLEREAIDKRLTKTWKYLKRMEAIQENME